MKDVTIIGAGLCSAILAEGFNRLGYNVQVLAFIDSESGYKYSDFYDISVVERTHLVGGNTLNWHAGLMSPDKRWMIGNDLSLTEFKRLLSESSEISTQIFGNKNFFWTDQVRPHNSRIYYVKGPRVAKINEPTKVIYFNRLINIDLQNKKIVIDNEKFVNYNRLVVATDAIGAAEIYSKYFSNLTQFNLLDHPLVYIGEIVTNRFMKSNLSNLSFLNNYFQKTIKRGLIVSACGARHMVYLRPKGSQMLHRIMVSNIPLWKKYFLLFTNIKMLQAALYLKWGIEMPRRNFEAFAVLQMTDYATLDTVSKSISYGESSSYEKICSRIGFNLNRYKFIRKFNKYSNFVYYPGNHFSSTLSTLDLQNLENNNDIFFTGSSVMKGNSYTNTGVQIMVLAVKFLKKFK